MRRLTVPRKVISVVSLLSLVFILSSCGGTSKVAIKDDRQLSRDWQKKESPAPALDESPDNETDNVSSADQNIGDVDTTPDEPLNEADGTTGDELRQEVLIKDLAFEPAEIRVKPGTTIVWNNQDATAHEVHANDDAWHADPFGQGETFEMDFSTPGTYGYHCHIHPVVNGIIIVEQAE